jgi:phospholipase/lecithinase/hemolysin
MNDIKSSQAIRHVNAELQTNVSETGLVSNIRVYDRADHLRRFYDTDPHYGDTATSECWFVTQH